MTDQKMKKSSSIAGFDLWQRYHFFSDNTMQRKLDADVRRLGKVPPNPLGWERPSKLVDDNCWDKYFFFADSGQIVHKTSQKGRQRVAAIGPNTFGPEFVKKHTPALDPKMKLEATTYSDSYKQRTVRTESEPVKLEPSRIPHIFPEGHQTIDLLYKNPRPAPKAATYMY